MARRKSDEAEEKLPDFEEALAQIQQIIESIESGDVPLEQSLEQYARGMKLIQHCQGILDRAETRIQQLTVDDEGRLLESGEAPVQVSSLQAGEREADDGA